MVKSLGSSVQIVGLSANSPLPKLVEQVQEFRPNWVVATDEAAAKGFDWPNLASTKRFVGRDYLNELVALPDVDLIVCAIVGVAGLQSTLAAVGAGKTVALANKETLVAAGPLVMRSAETNRATILPVDSEHSAVFQAAHCGRRNEIRRIILTASGGPFRDFSPKELQHVTLQQALDHPTWDMGKKVTIDSATMMNKALEVIEARWLFDLDASAISVMIHPQSIVHSMIEFVDGSVIAQMSPPDMRLPIQYALTYPHRREGPSTRLNWQETMSLEFYPPDPERFPAIELGLQVARDGGTCGAVVNAANEAAVAAYLANEIAFVDIVPACARVLSQHNYESDPTLDEILRLDRSAHEEVNKWICA